ncbi:2-hydroxyhepta-2,4-diene-1,7-dioate isomerase, partial [Amycolatopsis vancoresmycina DSM 44592]
MRFQRLGDPGREIPVVLDETGAARDLRALTPDIDGAFFAAGGVARARAALSDGTLPVLDSAG